MKLSIGAKWGSFCTDTFLFALILDDFEAAVLNEKMTSGRITESHFL